MKKTLVIIATLLALLTIFFGVSSSLQRYLYSVRVGQYLALADDASLPAMKREYLGNYRSAVTRHIHRDHARYFLKQERLTRTAQLANLDSLMKRLEDIAHQTPDSLAYQQGMLQITGQEFDHTIAQIDAVFYGCYLRQAFFARYMNRAMFYSFLVLCGIALFFLMILTT